MNRLSIILVIAIGSVAWLFSPPTSADAAPPTPGNRLSVAGGAILSVPVDPYMTADEEQRILDVLSRPMQVSWDQTTPELVARDLNPHIRTRVDIRALEDLGLSPDQPLGISDASNTVPLGSNLIAVLKDADLTFEIRGNVLTITTADEAEDPSQMPVRIYDVTPLVVRENADGVREANSDALVESIQTVISPDTWEYLGGPSTMQSNVVRNRSLLTIATTTINHLMIQAYLDRLNSGPATMAGEDIPMRHQPRPQYPWRGAGY